MLPHTLVYALETIRPATRREKLFTDAPVVGFSLSYSTCVFSKNAAVRKTRSNSLLYTCTCLRRMIRTLLQGPRSSARQFVFEFQWISPINGIKKPHGKLVGTQTLVRGASVHSLQ